MSSKPPAAPVPKTLFLRDLSGGVNLSTAREAIEDNQAWWMEGVVPVAPGNLQVVSGPLDFGAGGWNTALSAENSVPSFIFPFVVGFTDYFFVVFGASTGNGYVGDIAGITVTKIFNGTLTSGQTAAAQWNDKGLLIVDPAGYWDWNITVAATLTALNNSVQSITIVDGGSGYGGNPTVTFSGGGGGTGAVGAAWSGLGSCIITTPGSNYKVGDVLGVIFTLGIASGADSLGQVAITVTTVNATGGVTGVRITNPGSGLFLGANPSSASLIGGSGTGAVANLVWVVSLVQVTTRGHGYTVAPTIGFTGGTPTRAASATANISGDLSGTAIATYAERAWIASGRTVTFTDVDQYASFINSGSSFTINDDTLHSSITALYAANDYLYIFGASSADVLSNVTVTSAGTASFSRVNVSASIGCSQPNSIFSYYRSIAFASEAGFFLLSGATPEKISDPISLLVPQIDFTAIYNVSGCIATIGNQLCAAWHFNFANVFNGNGATEPMIAAYFKGKWFFLRQALNGTKLTTGPIVSNPDGTTWNLTKTDAVPYTMYTVASKKLYQLVQDTAQTYWKISTKLYDMGKPMWTKQVLRGAMGVQMGGTQATRTGITFTADNEVNAGQNITPLIAGTFTGYKSFIAGTNQGNGQFIGATVAGVGSTQADITRLQWIGLQYTETTEWGA